MIFKVSFSFKVQILIPVLPLKKLTLVWFLWTLSGFHPESLSRENMRRNKENKCGWWVLEDGGKVASVFLKGKIICSDRVPTCCFP